ncbi:TonB-dependent receptor SusC [termite gut metagenome]|uniref:TonB-dependent receptor SusC n=1 Tax=termite gut metagenome TaxID=433724 RepID=A0A5J4QTW1_9ZZZZ
MQSSFPGRIRMGKIKVHPQFFCDKFMFGKFGTIVRGDGMHVFCNSYNSIADYALRDQEGLDKWFIPDVTLKLNVLTVPGLSFQQSTSYDYRQWENHIYESRYRRSEVENSRTGYASLSFSKTEYLNSEGYASYINTFNNNHTINAVAGYSYQERNAENFNLSNRNFTNDKVKYWNIGEGLNLKRGEAEMGSGKDITERLFALFARANYSYQDKYMLTATVRNEGSSKFAYDNRWGLFWSLSGGWRIFSESFLKNVEWVNDLKIRAGYRITGNNDFSATYAATRYGSDVYWLLPNGNWAYTYGKAANVNPELGWEETHDMNFGLDFSLFNNKLYGKVDVYRRKTEGLIYEVQVPQPPYVEQRMHMNIGNMESKGWEVELGGEVVRTKDWNYNTSVNLSHNNTKILTLWGNQTYYDYVGMPSPGDPGSAIRIEEGVDIGSFFLWKYAGVGDEGNFLLYNKNDDVIPYSQKKTEDKRHIGNYTPTLMLGWNHNLSYKNWDLSMTLTSWIDFDVYNTVDMYLGLPYAQPLSLNVLANAYEKNSHIKGEKQLCDYFLEDGTFVKIQNINLGYTLNLQKYTKFIERVRCYLTIDNVAKFTSYSGINPEVQITDIEGGIEKFWDLYPQTRRFALGVQLTF